MSLPRTTGGYGLGPGEGDALWFNGGLGLLKATGDQTEGRFAVMELLAPKGFAARGSCLDHRRTGAWTKATGDHWSAGPKHFAVDPTLIRTVK